MRPIGRAGACGQHQPPDSGSRTCPRRTSFAAPPARAVLEEQNGYTVHAGLPTLRERVAGDYAFLRGDSDRVIITAGAQEALYLALTAVVDEGDGSSA